MVDVGGFDGLLVFVVVDGFDEYVVYYLDFVFIVGIGGDVYVVLGVGLGVWVIVDLLECFVLVV